METSGEVGKSGLLEYKISNVSEMRKDRGKVTMDGTHIYRAHRAVIFAIAQLSCLVVEALS